MKADLMLVIAAIFAAVIVTVAGCATQPPLQQQPQPQQPPTNAECVADSDCGVGGCSGQVCTAASEAAGVITTCEYRPEYDCLKLTSCGCVNGKCAWKETADYDACLDRLKVQQNKAKSG